MIISNGEPFIKLEVAVKAFFYFDLCFSEPDNRYFEQLEKWLDLYTFVNGIGNIWKPSDPTLEGNVEIVPKKIEGMCKIKVELPSYEQYTYHGVKPIINLSISPFLKNIPPEFINCSVNLVENYINQGNYFRLSYVHLTKFLNHAKEVGVVIDANFLEEIIINDSRFTELKRLSKQRSDGVFSLNQAANGYLPYFDGVLTETIIEGCALASAQYDRKKQIEATKTENEVIKDDVYELSEIFSDLPATKENITLLKASLSEVWQEALFNQRPLTAENKVEQTLFPKISHTSENLELLKEVILEFWEGKDPKRATNAAIQAHVKEISPETSETLAKNIAMIVRPDKYK